jgi:hypothetical protein
VYDIIVILLVFNVVGWLGWAWAEARIRNMEMRVIPLTGLYKYAEGDKVEIVKTNGDVVVGLITLIELSFKNPRIELSHGERLRPWSIHKIRKLSRETSLS